MRAESTLSTTYGNNQEAVKYHYAYLFQNQENVLEKASIFATEVEKTIQETEIISLANFHINQIRLKYNQPELIIPDSNIHILPTDFQLISNDRLADGVAMPQYQAIIMPRNISTIGTAKTLFHEMIHLQGYFSDHAKGDQLVGHRRGLIAFKGDNEHFRLLDEAVTEELTREFLLRYQDNPLFRSDVHDIKSLISQVSQKFDPFDDTKEMFEKNGLLFPQLEPSRPGFTLVGFAYPVERSALNSLIDKVYESNRDVLKSRKQVFNKFVNALFSGHIYELGKLIDSTFGSGTFRSIGEIEEPEELLNYVKSLK